MVIVQGETSRDAQKSIIVDALSGTRNIFVLIFVE